MLDFVFIIDRSGSMSGWKMDAAKRTLQLCLRSVPEGSLFQIVSFGSSYDMLFPEGRCVAVLGIWCMTVLNACRVRSFAARCTRK